MDLRFWRAKHSTGRWLAMLQGTEMRFRGKMMVGFTVERVVHAASEYEARVAATKEVIAELRRLDSEIGQPPTVLVKSIRELGPREMEPKVEGIQFFEREDQTKFFDELATRLGKYDLSVTREEDYLSATSPDGYPVSVEWDGEFTVSALQWHQHFDDPDSAISCFRWLLTPYCRIVSEERDGEHIGTWVERYTVTGWQPIAPVFAGVGDRQPEDPGPYRLTISQQSVLNLGDYQKIEPGAQLDEAGLPIGSHFGTRIEARDTCTARALGILTRSPFWVPEEGTTGHDRTGEG